MSKKLILVLVFLLLLIPIQIVRAEGEEPTCELHANSTNTSIFEGEVYGFYSGAYDGQARIDDWGHGGDGNQKLWFHGNEGTFENYPHVFPSYGEYTVTMIVEGPNGSTATCTDTIKFEEPSHVAPTCTIETHKDSGDPFLYRTTFSWNNTYEDWFLFQWGDEEFTGAEPPGFRGPNGSETWSHVYNPGTWDQWANVDGPGGSGGCKQTVVVEKPPPPPPCPKRIYLPIVMSKNSHAINLNKTWKVKSIDDTLRVKRFNGEQSYSPEFSGKIPSWLPNWTALTESNHDLDIRGSILFISINGQWVKYKALDGTWAISIHKKSSGHRHASETLLTFPPWTG